MCTIPVSSRSAISSASSKLRVMIPAHTSRTTRSDCDQAFVYVVISVYTRAVPRKERKGEPLTVRLSPAAERLVRAEARRTRRSIGAVVESFTEETARSRRLPGIGFRGEDARRRAWVIGSGLDIWEIVQMLEEFGSVERLVRETHLTERQVRLALAFREQFPDEIGEAIADNRRPVDELHALYPFVGISELRP